MDESTYMKKEELQDLVLFYKDNLDKEYVQIDIMFVQKTSSKKRLYNTWMLVCRDKDIKDMISETLETMNYIVQERKIGKYDLELSADDTVQVVEVNQVLNYKDLENSLTLEYTNENTINNNTDYNKFDFVFVKLSDNTEENPRLPLTILKKHMKSPAKFKGTRSFIFNGNEAKVFDTPLLIIGSNVEAFNVGGLFYIFNRNNFNSMMNFKDIYYRIVDSNAESIVNSELFDNADEFIAECRNNGRYVTRLTKAILADGFKNVRENKDRLNDLKSDYGLKLEFTPDGKIIFQKECVDEILNMLLEHYVTSALTDKKMLALAIEKYE